MKPLQVRAHAKVNLTLEVLGRRTDGFHEVASIMQTISLSDELSFEPASELVLTCDSRSLENPNNLVLQAARLLQRRFALGKGACIHLKKGIPLAAGLGGGSSDAAATIWALNQVWGLHRPSEELAAFAGELGADVPFLLTGGACLAEGRGDCLTHVPNPPETWLVVALPDLDIPNKTAEMYRRLPSSAWTRGEATRNLRRRLEHGDPLRESALFNVFTNLSADVFPEVGTCRSALLEAAWARPVLAGAGPALFIMVADQEQGLSVAGALRGPGVECWVTRTVPTAREEFS
ncbi:MAG: 4-(cytidine 5'-diphospho)-2-C-methyl-D-erythritol kinase [Dehalococcoidia bacterium]|nr:4-(cytidine 5'-diphospho)-2-C-methyl-D-erythritol kinase [Dehalococcoidia bacterium]